MESFSQRVKNQICLNLETQICCQQAFVFAILYFSRGYNKDIVAFHTENKAVAEGFAEILIELTGVGVSIYTPDNKDTNRLLYSVTLDHPNEMEMVLEYLNEQKDDIILRAKKQNCCRKAFLTGAFLISGTFIDPIKDYHFEICLSSEKKCNILKEMFLSFNIELKLIQRRNEFVLYTKNSEDIEDILTLLNATDATFELINLKIEKEMRNKANRITNCETANIDKTINAATKQIQAINKLKNNICKDLPKEIIDVMDIRLENPTASLSELCQMFPYSISKATLNRRLQKIIKLSEI